MLRTVVAATALLTSLATLASAAETFSLSPPVYLPDGQEFKTWEVPPSFSRTYYVAQAHPRASDDNPGTEALPFRTINRAAQVLQPGERVVVATGTYRERVRPARGGAKPRQMISYEAAPGATVVLSGSRVLDVKWTHSTRGGKSTSDRLWMATLPHTVFEHENPFALLNLTDGQIDKCMDWAVDTKGKPPNTLRRGLIFQRGQRLLQVEAYEKLSAASGSYWVEADGLTVHVHPRDNADPNRTAFEVTTGSCIFAPDVCGLGYIRVKGLTIEHSAGRFPRPQEGALSTRRGHHWLIEDNTVRQCNAIGMDIGDQFDTAGPRLAEGGQHIVRRNTVSDCGIGGIEGKCLEHTLIEDNRISRCGWHRAERIWETGGIKIHCTQSTLVRRNLIADSLSAPGIWMDYANKNSRCTQNVVLRAGAEQGGIFIEASQAPNLVDHNIVWGSTNSGIYQHDCDELVIAHNLVLDCGDAGIRMQIVKGRKVDGRLSTAKRCKILNNILAQNGQMMAISDPDNFSDGNLFGASRKPFDLCGWQKKYGWDQHSVVADIQAALDPQRLDLTWSVRGVVPRSARPAGITFDFWGRPYTDPQIPPGPFAVVPSSPVKVLLLKSPSPDQPSVGARRGAE